MVRKQKLAGAAAMLGLVQIVGISTPVFAQSAGSSPQARSADQGEADPQPQNKAGDDDIVVVGFTSRDAQSGLFGKQAIVNTPFSITAFNEDLIQTQQARTITDVTMNDPSVRNNVTGNSESEQFTIRGFPLFASEVAVEGLYGMLPTRRVPIETYSRVEVFKGPNALVNGITPYGNIGGVINLVPKRGKAKRNIDLAATYLSDGQFGANIDIGGRVGANDEFGARTNLARYDGDLSIDDARRRTNLASLALDYSKGPLRLTADLLYMNDRLMGQDFNLSAGGSFQIPKAPDNTINFGQPWTLNTNYTRRAMAGASYEIFHGTTISARYGILQFGEEWRYVNGTLSDSLGKFSSRYSSLAGTTKTRTGDIAIRSIFNTGPLSHSLAIVGTKFFLRQFSANAIPGLTSFTNNIYNPVRVARPDILFNDAAAAALENRPRSATRNLKGIAVADTIGALDERLLLTVGLRRQSIDIINYNRLTGAQLNRYKQSKITPALGLVFKPTSPWSVYGSFSKGLTPGPFAPGGTTNQGTVFAPFVSTQYEFGSKVAFDKWSASVALFRITQPFGYVNASTNTFIVDGSTINKGVELNVSGVVTEGLTVLGGLAYFDGKLAGTANGTNDGKSPVGVPKVQVNLFAEYAPQFLHGFAVNGRYIYTAKQFYDPANLQAIPSWSRFDIGASQKLQVAGTPLVFRVAVENVANSSYWQSTARSFITRGAPRTVRASLEASF